MATAIQTPSDTNNKVRFASTGRPRGGGGDLRSNRQPPPSSSSKISYAMDSNSDVAAPSMYDTSTSESWSTSDGRTNPSSNYSSYNPSKASTSQQQQQQQQFHYQRTSNSSSQVVVNDTANTSATTAMSNRGDFAPQRYPTQSPARQPEASPNTSMSSASTKVHQNIYQKDFSRSQHDMPTTTKSTTAMSEPGTSEERYAAYLSRVATFDPRITKETKSSSSSSSRQGVYSNRAFPTSSNQSDSSTFSKHGIMEKKDSFLSKASVPSQSTSAVVAPSVTSSTNTVDRLQENRDSAPNRYRADRRTRLEKLSLSVHSRARSASRSITPTNREARGRSGGVTAAATTAAATTTTNKQVAWKSVETQGQHQAQQHAQHSELTVDTAPAPASPTADQMEQERAVIETPSPAKVEELKRQLWSDDEQLKNWSHVSGEKILQAGKSHQRRHKSLSPDRPQYRKHLRSERVATAYGGGGGGSSSDNEGAPRVSSYYQQHSHSQHNRPSSNSGAVQDGSSPNRVFRSRFYAAAIAAHRGKEPSIQATPSKELSTAKSAITTSHRGLEIARSNSTPSFNPTSYTQPIKGAIPVTSPHITLQPTTSKNHQQQQKQDMWRQAPSSAAAAPAARNQAESIPITQSSSTATSDNYVAKLVARLNAVRRDNPSAALAQIDAILRAESQSSSGDRQERADQEVAALNQAVPPAQRGFEQEEESEEEEEEETTSSGEDETTVSSITNPTFQSKRRNTDRTEAAGALVPHPSLPALPKTHVAEVNGYATPYTMQQQHPRHPWEAPNEKALKPKKIKATPPPSIRVTSPRETLKEQAGVETTDAEESVAARRLDRYMQNQQTSPVDPNNPAELAEKIRMWDEMSNPSVTQTQSREYQMSSGAIEGQAPPLEEVLSNATEDLGSIVTPADQISNTPFLGSKLTGGHPWDVHHPSVRASAGAVLIKDTSMLDGEGIETQPSRIQQQLRNQPATPANQAPSRQDAKPSSDAVESSAFFDVDERNRSSHASSQGDDSFGNGRRQRDTWNFSTSASQGRQVNTTSLSDEFDNAWVSLPPNAFFGRKGGPRLSASPDEKADLPATTMFLGTASTATKYNRWQQQQQQRNLQQQKTSLLPPAVTAAFDQVSLDRETIQPRSKGANIIATQHRSQKRESARRHEPSISPMLKDDPWLHSKNLDASGESELSAGIEVSLLETPAPVSTSQAPVTPKPNKSRLNFLRPILSRGRAQPATRSDVGEGVAYGSLTPKQQVLRNAQAANTKSPQRDIAFSPPRGRSYSFEEMGTTVTDSKPKNKTLAKKFSRLMKVYDDKPGF